MGDELLEFTYFEISEGDGVAVVLQHEAARFVHSKPLVFFVFALSVGLVPFRGGDFYFDDESVVEKVLHYSVVNNDAAFVPFAHRLERLVGDGGFKVVESSGLVIEVFGVGVIVVVENLVFETEHLAFDFLHAVFDSGVAALFDLPLEGKFEVAVFCCGIELSGTVFGAGEDSVFGGPFAFSDSLALLVGPTGEGFAIEEGDPVAGGRGLFVGKGEMSEGEGDEEKLFHFRS